MHALASLLPLGTPALPLGESGKYVAAAFIVFMVLLVVYVAIMAAKLQRIERELRELAGFAEARRQPDMPGREVEDMSEIDPAQPPTDSDRNLTPSEAVGGPGGETRDV
jgi:flagellar biosynthesis/type III secretory pathway M-ring protein FliF/YscJ